MKKHLLVFVFALIVFDKSFSQIRVPSLISDNMVLQRDKPVKVWGWASPKEKISLTHNKKTIKTTATPEGKWEIVLPAQSAATGQEIVLKGKNEIRIKNVAFGDVYFCSGQSNMVHQMELHHVLYAKDIAEANNPDIRHFWIPTMTYLSGPKDDIPNASWKVTNPENVRQFSAVAYFFAKKIYDKYKIPVGLINASVGGTPIEAWTSEDGLKDFESIYATIQKNKDTAFVNRFSRFPRPQFKSEDKGLSETPKWFELNYQPKGWLPITVPGYWEDQGIKDLNGVVWYRKEVEVSASFVGKPAKVFLGRIVDADMLYINGKQVGQTTYMYPQRRYPLPDGLLKAGKNIFVVKVTNNGGKGGFVPDKPYSLIAGNDTLDLKGTWQYKVGEAFAPMGGFFPGFSAQNQPAALYNAMAAPVTPYGIKGFLWYQGESNAGRPQIYTDLQKAQILDWRKQWNQGELPFLFVQLPNFMDASYLPSESQWAELREAQLKATEVPNTAMAVGIDLGEWNDIHPDNKKDVGERLALAAMNVIYEEKQTEYSGPRLVSNEVIDKKMVLTFDHLSESIHSKDGEELRWFSVAGSDKKFHWAKARIVDFNKIELQSDKVIRPKYVRYAWQDNPTDVNFYNSAGLPASPFRTDGQDLDEKKPWKGKKCAVVLTYDDALNVHLDNVIPALDSLGLKGTFYMTVSSEASQKRINDWRRAAGNGHELGNHTVYHPCDATGPGMSWVKPEYDLSKYTMSQIQAEIKMCNAYLKAIDGKDKRTFAFTCGHKKVAEGEFIQTMSKEFIAARSVRHEMHSFQDQKMMDIDCYSMVDQTGEQMIELVKQAEKEGKLLVFLFHGVGGEHNLNVSKEAHSQLIHYLQENQKDIYVDTMFNVSENINALRK
ncbi:MAG: polysaccharide deacetylase family protein [Cytophagaceae bacterium]|nr:polysaccharide deacetylase family protein [Cytophagaceae bacterium]